VEVAELKVELWIEEAGLLDLPAILVRRVRPFFSADWIPMAYFADDVSNCWVDGWMDGERVLVVPCR
jgi:hypothetical protein